MSKQPTPTDQPRDVKNPNPPEDDAEEAKRKNLGKETAPPTAPTPPQGQK